MPEKAHHRLAIITLLLLPLVFYLKYLFGGQMLFGTDWLGAGGYQMRLFMAEHLRAGAGIAYWMPAILSGQPTVAAFFGDLFYPTQFFRLFIPVHVVWAWTFYLHVFVAGLGTYLFLREHKVSVLPSALGGIGYMFAGSLLTLTYAGHDGRLIGCALMPLALFFLHRGMDRRRLVWFLLCGLMLALQLLSGHVQKVYYTVLILFAYFLLMWVRAIRTERSAKVAVQLAVFFGIGMGLALALSAVQYLPIYGNMPYAARGSERGYEYATSWSMPVNEALDLLSPSFSGILQNYHGKNPFKLHSEYMGLIPLLFALIGIIRSWRRGATKFFLFAFIITLFMAWGGNTPFYRIPYHLLPGISKFRGPGMIFFLASFSLAVLAGFGFDRALAWARKKKWGRPNTVIVLAAVLAAVMTIDTGLSLKLWNEKDGYIRPVPPPGEYFGPDEAITFLKSDTLLYRVMPLNYDRSDAGVLMEYGIQSAGGQMPNPLQGYQDFTGAGTSVMFQAGNLLHPSFMNLLNIKYVISVPLPEDVTRYNEQTRRTIAQLRQFFSLPQFTPVFQGRQYVVYLNQTALPRAFVAPGYEIVSDKDAVINRLMRPDFDPAQTVLLYDKPSIEPAGHLFASLVGVVEHVPNRVLVRANLTEPGLVVLSENWHPAWNAFDKGKEIPVLRAYHTLRAVALEAGEHEIEFRYQSPYDRNGLIITLAALAFLVAVVVVSGVRRKKT